VAQTRKFGSASMDGDIVWVSGPLPSAVHDLTAARIWGILRRGGRRRAGRAGRLGLPRPGRHPYPVPGRNEPAAQKQANRAQARLRGRRDMRPGAVWVPLAAAALLVAACTGDSRPPAGPQPPAARAGTAHPGAAQPGTAPAGAVTSNGCAGQPPVGPLPTWARAGFSPAYILTGSVRAELENQVWPGTGRLLQVPMYGLSVREVRGTRQPDAVHRPSHRRRPG
jgi:hypothetical protein